MTDTISDEARELLLAILARLGVTDCQINSVGLFEQEIGAALTAARADEREKALEDAEKIARDKREQWSCAGGLGGHSAAANIIADAIRAMKGKP